MRLWMTMESQRMNHDIPSHYFHGICYRAEDYHCASVSHLFGLPLS